MRSEGVEARGRRWWFNDDDTDLNCVSGAFGETNALDSAAAEDEMTKVNKSLTILLLSSPPLIYLLLESLLLYQHCVCNLRILLLPAACEHHRVKIFIDDEIFGWARTKYSFSRSGIHFT